MPQQTPRQDSSRTFPPNKKEVCQACRQYGHNQPTCYLTPKLLHILEWAKTNKEKIQPLLRKHKSMNSLDGRRAVVRHIMDMENVDEVYEDDIPKSIVYNDQIENIWLTPLATSIRKAERHQWWSQKILYHHQNHLHRKHPYNNYISWNVK